MSSEFDFQVASASESKALLSVVPCVARLSLAVLIALAALIVLCDRLSMARHQVLASHTVIMTEPVDRSTCALRARAQDISTGCRYSALSGTKQIAPLDPDTGSVVSVSFIITGLGLKQVDVVLVHDVSGSMGDCITPGGESHLKAAKAAALTFVKALSDTDRAGVVAYHNRAWVVQSLVSDQNIITNAITDDLPASEGRTNIGEGIQAGYRELITDHWRPKAVKAMILLSDGGANEPRNHPVYDPEGYTRFRAEEAGRCGILIYTIGLGQGVSKTLMQDIADLSGGEYYFSPGGSDLETIYREIALELRNLVVTDTLLPGVDVDCSLWPPGGCSQADGLTTTVVLSPGNEILITDPLALSFTATVNLDPGYKGPISTEDPRMCYDGPGDRQCKSIKRRTVTVGGRKISGVVFDDLDRDGYFDGDEPVLSGVVVTTSSGLTSVTDSSGVYVLRTSATPVLTVAVKIPPGFVSTTSEITRVPPASGTYRWNFGLHYVLGEGISLNLVEPDPKYHGEPITLHYSVVNHGRHNPVRSGTVHIMDSMGRTFAGASFDLDPRETIVTSYSPLTVPRDVLITLTATALGGIQQTLLVSDLVTAEICPEDIYEPDDTVSTAGPIHPDELRLHDFCKGGDEDWGWLRLRPDDRSIYTFAARPLGPRGVHICLALTYGNTTMAECNTDDHQSPVAIMRLLSCTEADGCDCFLRVYSPSRASSCWTDYELSVEEKPMGEPQSIWLPIVLRNS